VHSATDSVLWNAMVVPYTVGPMAIRTAIWYQGESNVGQAALYDCRKKAMISDWRANFKSDFTFGFVQIAACDCSGDTFAAGDLRQAQTSPLYHLENIAIATSIDLVDIPGGSTPQDIHPPAKQPVGQRLADQIMAREYGMGDATVAVYGAATAVTSGTEIVVTIELAGCADKCELRPPKPCPKTVPAAHCGGFAIETNDGKWIPASAIMVGGSTLQLSADAPGLGYTAKATSYGRAMWPLISLYSTGTSLPVLPWCNTIDGVPCYMATEEAQ